MVVSRPSTSATSSSASKDYWVPQILTELTLSIVSIAILIFRSTSVALAARPSLLSVIETDTSETGTHHPPHSLVRFQVVSDRRECSSETIISYVTSKKFIISTKRNETICGKVGFDLM
jgi:hypothetical protein